jgi:hypothetical protein
LPADGIASGGSDAEGDAAMDDHEQAPVSSLEDSGQLLQYDLCKHLTSLAILVLGGVLIIAKEFDPTDVKPTSILIAMALVTCGGVFAFSSSSEIVRSRSSGTKPKKSQKILMQAGAGFLAVGTGYFLALFADSLV